MFSSESSLSESSSESSGDEFDSVQQAQVTIQPVTIQPGDRVSLKLYFPLKQEWFILKDIYIGQIDDNKFVHLKVFKDEIEKDRINVRKNRCEIKRFGTDVWVPAIHCNLVNGVNSKKVDYDEKTQHDVLNNYNNYNGVTFVENQLKTKKKNEEDQKKEEEEEEQARLEREEAHKKLDAERARIQLLAQWRRQRQQQQPRRYSSSSEEEEGQTKKKMKEIEIISISDNSDAEGMYGRENNRGWCCF